MKISENQKWVMRTLALGSDEILWGSRAAAQRASRFWRGVRSLQARGLVERAACGLWRLTPRGWEVLDAEGCSWSSGR